MNPTPWTNGHGRTRWQPVDDNGDKLWRVGGHYGGWTTWSGTKPTEWHATATWCRPVLARWEWSGRLRGRIRTWNRRRSEWTDNTRKEPNR